MLGHKSDDVSDTLLDAAGQETRCKENEQNFLFQLDDMRVEVSRREQEIMQMATKMKTLEEQHQDYQKHIAVLKESLCAKEEHYTMLQTDVSSVHSQANRKVHSSLLIITSPYVCIIHFHPNTGHHPIP